MSESWVALGSMLLASVPVLVISCGAVALLQVYLTRERIQILLGAGGIRGYLVTVGVGIVTPFSAASGLPLAAGLLEAGAPLGLITTFLVVCPFISPVPIMTVSAARGWMAGAVYFLGVTGLGVVASFLLDRLGLGRLLPRETLATTLMVEAGPERSAAVTVLQRTWAMIRRVTPYLAAGLALALLAYLFLPGELLAQYVGRSSWWSLPMAAGLKLPESLFLARLLGPRILAYLLGVVAVGAMGAGYLFERLGG